MNIAVLHVLAIAAGGAVGGVARFWVSGVIARRIGEKFPWGTLVVNVTGATLIGVAAGLALAHEIPMSGEAPLWALLVIGVLGSYTTVSSFSYQTLSLLHSGEPGRAAANVAASVSLCLGAAAASFLCVGWLLGA